MKAQRKLMGLVPILALALSRPSLAASPTLNDIDRTDLDNVSKEFSANFMHTTVSSAKSLGHVWGFEVGLIAGITKTPKLEALVHEMSPSTNIDKVPHGGLLAMLTVPYAITGEFTMIPEKTVSDVTVQNASFGLKWTVTDLFPIPLISEWVQAAVRLHYANSDLGYKQRIQNASTGNVPVDGSVTFDSSVWGMNATVSGDILIFEPYVGFGFVKSKTDVKVDASGTATIFSQTLSLSDSKSASSSISSGHLFAGVQMDLFLFHLSAEASRAFGATSYTGKFSFYF